MSERRSSLFVKLAVIVFVSAGAYVHGCRVITLEEVPSSHRPWDLYLTADYAQKHLTEANWIDNIR